MAAGVLPLADAATAVAERGGVHVLGVVALGAPFASALGFADDDALADALPDGAFSAGVSAWADSREGPRAATHVPMPTTNTNSIPPSAIRMWRAGTPPAPRVTTLPTRPIACSHFL